MTEREVVFKLASRIRQDFFLHVCSRKTLSILRLVPSDKQAEYEPAGIFVYLRLL